MRQYIEILMARSLQDVIDLSLQKFIVQVPTAAVCLLLWDKDLGRYIIGETYVALEHLSPAQFRRQALRHMDLSQPNRDHALHDLMLICDDGTTIGAVVYHSEQMISSHQMQQYVEVVCHAIDMTSRLEAANRERQKQEADTLRLEQLLQAVEQQQRTIDHLLTVEREWSAELEKRVEEHTKALKATQKQLIQSEKLAVIGQLARSLAHELNNPLQAINSGVGLMLDELECGNLHQIKLDLGIIQEELERVESIFRQMLDFYRPAQVEQVPLDLNEICKGLAILMRKRLQQSNVTLNLDLHDPLPLTCGDRNQIKQILINLILNATEAMEPDGGSVTLKTLTHSNKAMIAVIDDGPGIAAADIPHLFEPLFTTKTRGLGLGLAISQEIAQQHKGYIRVESQLDLGTTFELQLPIQKDC